MEPQNKRRWISVAGFVPVKRDIIYTYIYIVSYMYEIKKLGKTSPTSILLDSLVIINHYEESER